MDQSNRYSILMIDSPTESLPMSREADPSVLAVATADEAFDLIRDPDRRIGAIFLNPSFPRLGGIKFIRLAREYRPATPLYLLYDQVSPFDRLDLARMGITAILQRPLSASGTKTLLSEEIFQTQGVPAIKGCALPVVSDEGFLAVPITDFLSGVASGYDIHVRLPSGRFLKLATAKDTLTAKRVRSYVDKGVTHFYIRKESRDRCLAYCDVIGKYLLSRPGVSTEAKISAALSRGQDLIERIRVRGIEESELEFAAAYLSDVRGFINTISPKEVQVVRKFLSHLPAYDHAVKTTIVASLICLPLGIKSHTTFLNVGIATLLHDIGLYQLPKEIQETVPSRMSPDEMKIYQTHPKVGADLLSRIRRIDSVIIQAVAQHHQRRDNSGFPARIAGSDTNRVAEIIGIADEFIGRLDEKNTWQQVMDEMEEGVFDGFSYEVSEAFRTVFMRV